MPAMMSIALLGIAVAIVAEGSLGILGVSVDRPLPRGATIITTGRTTCRPRAHRVHPCIVIFFTVLSLNYLGDVVRGRFDVRESAL